MVFLAPGGCPERPSPPPGFQRRRPSRAVRTRGFAQWAERRRPGMESAALRYAALAGCARRPGPRGGSAGRISAPSARVSPLRLAMRCPGKSRDSRGSGGALLPCLGVAFRPFCSPGRRIGFCFLSRELGGGRFRPPRLGKFPPLPWHPALVAGGGLPRHPAQGAQHPLLRGAERGPPGSPAHVSRPARPSFGSTK